MRSRSQIGRAPSSPSSSAPGLHHEVATTDMNHPTSRDFDIAIVGAGPAGLAAGLYAGRNRMRTALLEARAPGGQLLNTELIEDYPGQKSILGGDLAAIMLGQTLHFGAELITSPVKRITVDDSGMKHIETGEGEVRAAAVILTAGGNPRKLDVPGEVEFAGRGVSYCAVCDGAFFKGADLAVVGGGDAAVEEGLFLTRYARRVTIIHRRNGFRAQSILVEEARRHPQVSFILNTVVEAIAGGEKVSGVKLRHVNTGETSTLPVGGVFVFVGFVPNTGLVDAHLEHDSAGYYVTDPHTMMTNVPGIFAAGDVRSQLTRQITTAVGDATTATMAAMRWVEDTKRRVDVGTAEQAQLVA